MQDWQLNGGYKGDKLTSFAQEWLDPPGNEPKDVRARRCIGSLSPTLPKTTREHLIESNGVVYRTYYWCNKNCLIEDPSPKQRTTVKDISEMADEFEDLETTDDLEKLYSHVQDKFERKRRADKATTRERKERKERSDGEDDDAASFESEEESEISGRFRMRASNRTCKVDLLVSTVAIFE
jgi:hypothetical protein